MKTQEIQDFKNRVQEEIAHRAISPILTSLLILCVCVATNYRNFFSEINVRIATALIIVSLVLRIFAVHFRSKLSGQSWISYFRGTIILANICWGFLVHQLLTNYHADSFEFGIALFLMVGFIAAPIVHLGFSKIDYAIYLFSFVVFPTAFFVSGGQSENLTYLGIYALYLAFLFSSANVQQNEFKNSHEQQLALTNSRNRTRGILDAIPGAIMLINSELKLTEANIGVLNLTLPDSPASVGCDIRATVNSHQFSEALVKFVNSNYQQSTLEAPITTSQGERWYLFSFCKLNSEFLIAGIDIHEKHLIEKRIDAERAKMQSASKLASLGEMAGGMAHEINNPLAIISGKIQLTKKLFDKEPLDRGSISQGLEKIEQSVDRIAKIINGLRTFARDGSKDAFSIYSAKAIVHDALSFCQSRLVNNGVNVTIAEFDDFKIECRPNQITQILLNLLTNSDDAIQNLSEKWIQINVRKDGHRAIFEVTDSGLGIGSSIRDKIMEPFFTTKEIGKASGMGLSVAKGMVEDHGGRIFIDEKSPHTRFTIEIPIQQNSAPTKQRAS